MSTTKLIIALCLLPLSVWAVDNNFGKIPANLVMPAGTSVRRNAGNTAFEAFTPGSGGGGIGGSIGDQQIAFGIGTNIGGSDFFYWDSTNSELGIGGSNGTGHVAWVNTDSVFRITSGVFPLLLFGAGVSIGDDQTSTRPYSSSGDIRLQKNFTFKARNNANSGDIPVMSMSLVSGDNNLWFGDPTLTNGGIGIDVEGGTIDVAIGSGDMTISSDGTMVFGSGIATFNGSISTAKITNLTGNGFVTTSGSNGTLGIDTGSYQPLDADLTAIAALTTDAFGRILLTKTDGASVRSYIGAGTSSFDGAFSSLTGKPTTLSGYGITDAVPNTRTVNGHALSSNVTVTPTDLSLVIGTNVQAWDADLDTWATKTPYAGTVVVTTGKTFTNTNTLTISGTDGSTLNIGAGGTLGSNAFNSTAFGTGTVTNTGGNLTSNAIVLGAGTVDTKVVAGITTDGVAQINLGTNGGTGGTIKLYGGTSGSAIINTPAVSGAAINVWLPTTSTNIPIANQVYTFQGATTARTVTFPDANFTVARTDAANTFTGHQTIEGVTSTGATGSGKFVFDTSPALVTPALGVPASGDFSTGSFTWPTFNQNSTGSALYWKTSGTGKAAITGPATGTTRTYTFPDADATIPTTSSAVVGLFTSCSGTQYLGADGACHTAGGGGTIATTPNVLKGDNAGNAISTGLAAPTGAFVGTTDTQALTNKDLTGSGNTFPPDKGKVHYIGYNWNGFGTALVAADMVGVVTVPYAGTITGYAISVDTGTCTVKTYKKATGTAIPTSGDNISTSGVAISSGTHLKSATTSDFTTTTVTAYDQFLFTLSAVSSATFVTFQLEITE